MLQAADFERHPAEIQSEKCRWGSSANFSILQGKRPYADRYDLMDSLEEYGVIVGDDIREAIKQAHYSHGCKERDSGGSYIYEHLFPVAIDVAKFYHKHLDVPASSDVIVSSILHDAVEDDPRMDLNRLEDLFGRDVRNIVEPLTKIDWRDLQGANEEEKRRRLEIYKVEKQLPGAPEDSRIIKGFDRINNVRCLPIYDRQEKTERVYRNTRDIFMPWLKNAEPLIYGTLFDEMTLLEGRMESRHRMPERKTALRS